MYKRWRALLHTAIVEQQLRREQTHPVCSHGVEINEKEESLNTQTDYETTSKNEQIKKKQTSSLFFVNVLKVQDRLKKILRNKNDINKKRSLRKSTRHNDHYMINIGAQMPKIGGN